MLYITNLQMLVTAKRDVRGAHRRIYDITASAYLGYLLNMHLIFIPRFRKEYLTVGNDAYRSQNLPTGGSLN